MWIFQKGEKYIVNGLCLPFCHELWNSIYPSVYVLINGGDLDYGERGAKMFDAESPDKGRVKINGEVLKA